jgi:hypothetical protein
MPVRLRAGLGVAAMLVAAVLLWRLGLVEAGMAGALDLQRDLQAGLARAARALNAGQPAALWSLVGLSAVYGLAHAAGPGHGKALLGAAAVAGVERPGPLAALAVAAALAQALTAVLVVYGGLMLLSLSPMAALGSDATLFAPLGYAAAGAFGLLFAWRGARALRQGSRVGDWNTRPIRPAPSTVPSKARSSPAMMRSSVVFPTPEGPAIARKSPVAISKRMSPRIGVSPWRLARTCTRIMRPASAARRAPTGPAPRSRQPASPR